MKCLNPPTTAKKVEMFIKECQEEIKTKIVQEALIILNGKYGEGHNEYEASHASFYDNNNGYSRIRRHLGYNPTLVSREDKRIAGCLLHCIYAKNNAIDKLGWPTLDGLVHFYSDGVSDHAFFMATLRATNCCLRATGEKYGIDRLEHPKHGESCDLAFDVFDCVSDQMTEYCFDQFSP
ncbi:unnamed protein product [Hermetia illucens]|uniref:Uncharacterized protein n=2 Tax=Hermetia illucens TaxID=343691 RepID=A0A7R8YRL8_HERIL|nr:unnamed protein product [Hermetia illucens]